MSQTANTTLAAHSTGAAESATVVDEETAQAVLTALTDDDSRAILRATADEALSASEIRETCELPQSTTYRKLDQLSEAGLLEERIHLSRSGKHYSEYVRAVEDVAVSLASDGGVDVAVAGPGAEDAGLAAGVSVR